MDVVLAVLSTVLPSIERDDITSIRLLRAEKQDDGSPTKSRLERYRTPWVVSLSRSELMQNIMRAKNKLTAFNTKNVNVSPLNKETCNSLIQSTIFINEFLSKEQFLEFNHLKSIARGLGFKYIWHRGGRFLIKKRNGEKT